MEELDELKTIWAGQNNEKSNLSASLHTEDVVQKLRKLENFQKRVNRVKLGVIILLLIMLTLNVSKLEDIAWQAYAGLGLITLSTAVFMIYYFRNQFKSSNIDFTKTSMIFAGETLLLLDKQNKIFGIPFTLFIIMMVIASNLLLSGFSTDPHTMNALTLRVLFSGTIFTSGLLGLFIRRWRIKREVTPLMDELTKLKNYETAAL
ncbi:MAG: hypothetical protein AB9922_08425 [Bacteroidales bacterium]